MHIIATAIGALTLGSAYFVYWAWAMLTPLMKTGFTALPFVFASATALVVAQITYNDILRRIGIALIYPTLTVFLVCVGIEQFLL